MNQQGKDQSAGIILVAWPCVAGAREDWKIVGSLQYLSNIGMVRSYALCLMSDQPQCIIKPDQSDIYVIPVGSLVYIQIKSSQWNFNE